MWIGSYGTAVLGVGDFPQLAAVIMQYTGPGECKFEEELVRVWVDSLGL